MLDAGSQRDRAFDRLDDIGQADRRRRPRQLEPAADAARTSAAARPRSAG